MEMNIAVVGCGYWGRNLVRNSAQFGALHTICDAAPEVIIGKNCVIGQNAFIRKGATIGANATIICGHNIGKYAFIGAGAVIIKDVLDYALVYGNPAQLQGWVCECGVRLDFGKDSKAKCIQCGKEYIKQEVETSQKWRGTAHGYPIS